MLPELIATISQAIQIPSFSDQEGELARYLSSVMEQLGFDQVMIDQTGNLVGIVGQAGPVIHFDGHLDTVRVADEAAWTHPPFGGEIHDGAIWGRGSVDMKSGLICALFAAARAKQAGLLKDKQVIVTGSVCEEYCDGVNLAHFYQDFKLTPDYCIICEPTGNQIALGHKGKAQVRITTHGLSAHGSAPEKGVNAVYLMADIISRVDQLNQRLARQAAGGTVVLSDISSVSASLNAVPSSCTIYLDRRLGLSESLAQVEAEMAELIAGVDASWQVGTLEHISWTGRPLTYRPMHQPWQIAPDHALSKALRQSVEAVCGNRPQDIYWDFGTNAITPVELGIPTIGFGPGEYKLAHMVDEHCPVEQIRQAEAVYYELIGRL